MREMRSEHARGHGRWVSFIHAGDQRPGRLGETEDANMSTDIGKAARFRHDDRNSASPATAWSQ